MSAPLRRALDARIDEPRIQRVWRAIEPRVLAARAPRAPRSWTVPASIASLALVATVGVLVVPTPPAPLLALADGSAPTARVASTAETITFADGSRVALAAGAEIVPTRNDVHELALAVTRGVVDVSVVPGGPRRWRFDCGLAVVEVLGTEFRLDRSEAGLAVSVTRGHVRVSARDGRRWDLLAGDDVWIPRAPAPEPAAPRIAQADTAPLPPTPSVPASASPAPASRPPRTEPSPRWSELAESGAYDRAYDALAPGDAASAAATPRELMLLADVARLSGHPAEAVAPLERIVTEHPSAPEAPLAAVVLGRVQGSLGAPDRAAWALECAQALGVPAALAADVQARLALAYLALGDPRGAELARAYLAEHPDGPHAAALASRLE